MTEFESLAHERSQLREQNEQIKAKYKKSLQELMHILKVNKSLKECLDQNTKHIETSIREQIQEIRNNHQEELETYLKELDQYKLMYNEETIERKNQERKAHEIEIELNNTRQQLHNIEARLKEMQPIEQTKSPNGSKADQTQQLQNQPLKKKLMNYLSLIREKQQLQQQNQSLKQKINQLTIELIQQKQRYRSDIFSKETEFLRSKDSQYQKLKTIESKYQLLESELSNYKNVEKYFQDEANIMLDEDNVYNSIREQITKINEDFNKYELESSNLLLKKREEDAERNRKIVQLEKQVARLKFYEEKFAQKQRESKADKADMQSYKERVKHLEREMNQVTEKNHVLQAFTITDKHRVHSSITERIKEFETRIKLLLEENPKEFTTTNSVQQIIVLKGYISELSDLLKQSKKKEEHLSKKNQHYKEKLNSSDALFKEKLNEYKIKIKNYDILINKLYTALEEKFKQKIPEQIEKEFNTAISHYEQKMMQMSEEIIKLRAKAAQIEFNKEEQVSSHVSSLEAENQTYKEIISELSIRINELEGDAQQVNSKQGEYHQLEDEIKEKNKIVDQLAMQINNLNGLMTDLKEKESNTNEIIQSYEKKLLKYKEELQEKQKISSNLSRNSIDTASLIEKINYLEYELNKSKGRSQPTPKPDDFIKGLENKLSAQNQQLAEYKQEIDRLYTQLKTEKNQKKSNVVDQYSLIAELQKQITDGEIKVLNLQNEFHNKQAQYKDEIETYKYQSKALIEQLNSKHSEMMVYYQELNKRIQNEQDASRIQEMQRYVAELEQKNHDIIERFSFEASDLNSNILALRTNNLALRNELQNKEDAVNQLKHQLFNAELRSQKEKSISGSMIKSVSGSMVRDSIKQDPNAERFLIIIVLLSTEVESLRAKNQELESMYHEDLDKYREALKQLQTRQMQLCNSLQLSSNEVQQNKDSKAFSNILQPSQEEISRHEQISHLSQGSTNFLNQPYKPLENTIRSYEVCLQAPKSIIQTYKIESSVSIAQESPRKRRGISIKKIV